MEKLKFKSLYINFGCKRDFSKTDAYQQKYITKRWFVYYEYLLSTGTYKGFKAYGGINRYHTIASRFAEANKLLAGIEDLLESGFNPVSQDFEKKINTSKDPAELLRQMPIIEGLKLAYDRHSPEVEPKTAMD